MRVALWRMHRFFDPIADRYPRVATALGELERAMGEVMPLYKRAADDAPRRGRRA